MNDESTSRLWERAIDMVCKISREYVQRFPNDEGLRLSMKKTSLGEYVDICWDSTGNDRRVIVRCTKNDPYFQYWSFYESERCELERYEKERPANKRKPRFRPVHEGHFKFMDERELKARRDGVIDALKWVQLGETKELECE